MCDEYMSIERRKRNVHEGNQMQPYYCTISLDVEARYEGSEVHGQQQQHLARGTLRLSLRVRRDVFRDQVKYPCNPFNYYSDSDAFAVEYERNNQ